MMTAKPMSKKTKKEEEYDVVTICLDAERNSVIIPGRVPIGNDIQYDEGDRATAETRVNLPLRMDEEMLRNWIEEQMNRKGSLLRRKVERAKETIEEERKNND